MTAMNARPVLVLLAAAAWLAAQDAPKPDAEAKGIPGVVEFVFEERSPHSTIAGMCKRLHWTPESIRKEDPRAGTYWLADEKFLGWVPPGYDPKEAWGLLVWMNPIDAAWFDPAWLPVLTARKVLVIEPLRAGNDRLAWYRIGLALDAVHNMSKRHRIDPARVWAGGFSGGGRVASTLGLHWPDVFRGAYAMGGCNWYQELRNPKDGGKPWAAQIPKPAPEFLKLAKTRSRFVFLAGSADFNHDHAKAAARHAEKAESFANLLFQDVPGLDHRPPAAEWFEKGMAYLDVIR